jgi:hypothetical protein
VRAVQPVQPPSGTGFAGVPGRRLPRPARPPHTPGPARPALPVGRAHHPRAKRPRPDSPGTGRPDRGLYRHAAALWTAAAALGSANAAWRFIDHLRKVSPSDTMRAAQWTAGQVSLDDPGASESCCGRCARRGPATQSVPCSTATRPPRPASTGRQASPGCWGGARGRGRRRGPYPGRPGRRPRQLGDPEDLQDPLLRADQIQRAVKRPHPLQAAGQHPQPGGAEEPDLVQVDDELVVVLAGQIDEQLTQPRRGVDIDLALDVDDLDAVLGVVTQPQIDKSSSVAMASSRASIPGDWAGVATARA